MKSLLAICSLKSARTIALLVLLISLKLTVAHAGVGGGIAGTVSDASGAVVSGAAVTIANAGTGTALAAKTNAAGAYSFPSLPVGIYSLKIAAAGFRTYLRDKIVIDVDSSLLIDVQLQVGEALQTIIVRQSSVEVETSGSELGEVASSETIRSLPLNGRSYTDLLALQPGVLPATTLTASAVQGLGQTVFAPSGDLNPGVVSINGQRESANGYIVNGASAEEKGSMAAAIIPNLDSIAEFRILTSNYDAQYGNYSGGQINVVTKSGTRQFHGDAFEFNRNTVLAAAARDSDGATESDENQYGGTLGGPLARGTVFFADYQGTKRLNGIPTGKITVPTVENRQGDFTADLDSFTGAVSGPYLAGLLTSQLGYPVTVGEPYAQVFQGGTIPQSAWSAPAKYLLQYIPQPNYSSYQFSSSASNQLLNDNKGAARVDSNTRIGAVSFYFAIDDYTNDNPFPTSQGGATVPGFNALYLGGSKLFTLGLQKDLHKNWLNDFHASYTRDVTDLGHPEGGLGVSLAEQGFATGVGTTGIVVGAPRLEGVESVAFNNFTFGVSPNTYDQINNTYELRNVLAGVVRSHTLKFGVDTDYDQVNTYPSAQLNGSFQFLGSETGNDFADFLLGTPTQYTQNALRPFYGRNKYLGLFVQDSWRARSNLTLNLGLRWDRIEPWYEKFNNLETLVPGQQSVVFQTAPVGLVFPGDKGIARTLAPAGDRNFAPRIGIAYAPSGSDSFPGKLLGAKGASSLRAGYGIYFISVPEETLSLISDNAPYGFTYSSPLPPLFANPFIDAATGESEGQRFPVSLASTNVSLQNPDTTMDFSQFEPMSAIPGYSPTNRTAYAEQYTVSLQRQIRERALLTLSYVGSQTHRLLVLKPANPGDPALCLSLPGCGPFGEDGSYVNAAGDTVNGTRTPLGPAFGDVSYQTAIGNSTYNALEANLHYSTGRLELNGAYTYAKSLDQGSNFGEQVNPFNPSLSRGLSSFDMRHNFVASFNYELPFEGLLGPRGNWIGGWSLSGVMHVSSGVPVTLFNTGDSSLLGTMSNGVNNLPVDEPNFVSGPLNLDRRGVTYFNTALFSMPADGQIGNSRRRFFSGPGLNNFDASLEKTVRFSDSRSLLLRMEAFNALNHPQFFGPDTVNGNINSGSAFGAIVKADAPRSVQLVAKFMF